jgi:allantoate deiminase
LIEIHIEQGPAMWQTKVPISIVTAISGRKQYQVELKGVPNHAGSTPMKYRSDALVAAAKIITDLEQMAIDLSPHTVATVGRIQCEPNAINVIPGSVKFTIDLRGPDSDDLAEGHRLINQMIRDSGAKEADFVVTENQPVVQMNAELIARLQKSAGVGLPTTVSGALHDAAILAPHIPTAMIFIASKDGISHNPTEFSRIQDLANAASLLGKMVGSS